MQHATMYERFRAAADGGSHLPFLIYPRSATRDYLREGREISYGEVLSEVDRLADGYAAAGYRPGHRVAMVLGNRPEHFLHLFALNKIGVTAVPLNPDYIPHEFAYGIELPQCSLIVAAPSHIDGLRAVGKELKVPLPVVDGTDIGAVVPAPAHAPLTYPEATIDREALILYTSGTTGRPKGCILSNCSCLASGDGYTVQGEPVTLREGQDRVYNTFPTFHMNITSFLLNAMTRMRCALVVQDRFSASTWWSDIVESGATGMHYLGIIPPLLVKQPPTDIEKRHKVRFGLGAGVEPVVAKSFEERFGIPLVEGWGMTETSRTMHNTGQQRRLVDRAMGYPRLPLEARVVDENDQPLPPETPGELVVRCAGSDPRHGFFSGYLKQPEETERVWRNGWFHSGDIVKQMADGLLVFVERRKNIIRRSGENIAAAEVEEALITDPRVRGVAVMAVADEFHDEEVMACVVPMPEVARTAESALAIVTDMRGRIAHHKLPAWLAFVDELPVTTTQKIQKGLIFPENTDPRHDPRSIDLCTEKRKK